MIYDGCLYWFDGKLNVTLDNYQWWWKPTINNTQTKTDDFYYRIYKNSSYFPAEYDGFGFTIRYASDDACGSMGGNGPKFFINGYDFSYFFVINWTCLDDTYFRLIDAQAYYMTTYKMFIGLLHNLLQYTWINSDKQKIDHVFQNLPSKILTVGLVLKKYTTYLYINGELFEAPLISSYYDNHYSTEDFSFGNEICSESFQNFIYGAIYTNSLYNRALSSSEVALLHNFYMQYYNLT